jgi:hypothetical protein
MTDTAPARLTVLARLVIALVTLLCVAGVVWHGATFATMRRMLRGLADRPRGPMGFRFVLQPAMAAAIATITGLQDARHGRLPYPAALLRRPQPRLWPPHETPP